MTLVCSLAAQAPQPQEVPDRSELKLPALVSAKSLKVDPKDDELRKLLKARYNDAVGDAKAVYEDYVHGRATYDKLYGSWQRVVQAGLELCDKPAQKVALLTQYLEATKEAEKLAQAWNNEGKIRVGDLHRARYERLNAEILLHRAKREADKAKEK
jgi:hypothetical protein